MSALIADQLSFGWSPDELLFESVSLTIDCERVALVGRNGIGKSTLIELLVGRLTPSGGHIRLPERWLYLSQIAASDLTIGAALGIDRHLSALKRFEAGEAVSADYEILENNWDVEERALNVLGDFDVQIRTWTDPLSSLSGGQAMRVRLARAQLEMPELLILDEPTNDLDADGLNKLVQFTEAWSSGLLVVSHNRTLLSKVDRILELNASGLHSYGGNFEFYEAAKALERETAQRRLSDAEKKLKQARRDAQVRKERAERRTALGKRTKTGSLPPVLIGTLKRRAEVSAGKSQSVGERQVSEATVKLSSARKVIEVRDPLSFDIRPSGLSAKKGVLTVEDLTLQYPETEVGVLSGFSLDVFGPERIAIRGQNGSGKSSLLKAIAGDLQPRKGRVHIGVERFACLSQDASAQVADRTLLDAFLAENSAMSPNEARAALARFGFRNIAAEASLKHLSGGERLRASLAIALMSSLPSQLIILDEPTNHMDLESLKTLERALNAYDGALMVVSHDQYFLDAINVTREVTL
jgi:ATPase subunit of ABC transporter with duplicated ATPase domains